MNQNDTHIAFAYNARRAAPPEDSLAGRHGTRGKLDAMRRPSCGTGGGVVPQMKVWHDGNLPCQHAVRKSSGRPASGDGDQHTGNRGNNMADDALVLPTQSPESVSDEPGDQSERRMRQAEEQLQQGAHSG